MRLSNYIKELEEIQQRFKKDPIVVYSHDDEGNGFQEIENVPTKGQWFPTKHGHGEFRDADSNPKGGQACVCIN